MYEKERCDAEITPAALPDSTGRAGNNQAGNSGKRLERDTKEAAEESLAAEDLGDKLESAPSSASGGQRLAHSWTKRIWTKTPTPSLSSPLPPHPRPLPSRPPSAHLADDLNSRSSVQSDSEILHRLLDRGLSDCRIRRLLRQSQ